MAEPPQRLARIIADKNCPYCKGTGILGENWGNTPDYPMDWYVFWPCGCVEKRYTNKVKYYEQDNKKTS